MAHLALPSDEVAVSFTDAVLTDVLRLRAGHVGYEDADDLVSRRIITLAGGRPLDTVGGTLRFHVPTRASTRRGDQAGPASAGWSDPPVRLTSR